MIELTRSDTAPASVPAEIRRFADLVFAAEASYCTSRPWDKLTAVMLRWVRSPGGGFGVGLTPLEPENGRVGSPVSLLNRLATGAIKVNSPPVDGEHFGVLVLSPVMIMGSALEVTATQGRGWAAAAVTTEGWRLLLRHADGHDPLCQLASPAEAHELDHELMPPLARLNERFLAGSCR